MVRSRRPIVSTDGDTRSNGRVSQAGKVSTASAPRYERRSLATRSASPVVGTATTIGRRALSVASPAMARARAGSGTASTAEDRPSTDAKPGSSRRSGGRSRSNMEGAQATGADRSQPRPGALLGHHPRTQRRSSSRRRVSYDRQHLRFHRRPRRPARADLRRRARPTPDDPSTPSHWDVPAEDPPSAERRRRGDGTELERGDGPAAGPARGGLRGGGRQGRPLAAPAAPPLDALQRRPTPQRPRRRPRRHPRRRRGGQPRAVGARAPSRSTSVPSTSGSDTSTRPSPPPTASWCACSDAPLAVDTSRLEDVASRGSLHNAADIANLRRDVEALTESARSQDKTLRDLRATLEWIKDRLLR